MNFSAPGSCLVLALSLLGTNRISSTNAPLLLFRFNIQYGRVSAPDAEIVAAARNSDIHERILTFPDAYNTQVGEYYVVSFSTCKEILFKILVVPVCIKRTRLRLMPDFVHFGLFRWAKEG